jgi:ParB family transcriptional regulator, chromosome partitioning protein
MAIPIQKGRLGRGLASLIGETPASEPRLPAHGEQRLLSIDQLHPGGHNPRKAFGDIELIELAESIRQKGLLQPIIARPDRERGGFEIVAGERRWRAAQKASLHTVPVIVRELSDQEAAEFALIENVQRTDLNPIEEATGYSELIGKFGYTQEQVAEVIGKSRSHLANTLRLLRLPASVQALLQDGRLTSGHARALIGRDDAETLARRIVEEDLNVRAVEALVQDETRGGGPGGAAKSGRQGDGDPKDADSRAFEKDLSDSLGLKVEIKPGSGESGTLSIKYGNFDQLDYIRARLIGPPER